MMGPDGSWRVKDGSRRVLAVQGRVQMDLGGSRKGPDGLCVSGKGPDGSWRVKEGSRWVLAGQGRVQTGLGGSRKGLDGSWRVKEGSRLVQMCHDHTCSEILAKDTLALREMNKPCSPLHVYFPVQGCRKG